MKIGGFVARNVPAIFRYCEEHPEEFAKLQDARFSKSAFDVNYPFCKPVTAISEFEHSRYWSQQYAVCGTVVRVTSQWFGTKTSRSEPLFRAYLSSRGLAALTEEEVDEVVAPAPTRSKSARGRFKGHAIGNAQNALVRNILSRIGDETFNALDWEAVVADFGHACAYCGAGGQLVRDHVIPINKQALGEHRLGNLVPACPTCNAKKAGADYRAFLAHDPARLAAITVHLARHGYMPASDQAKLRKIIALAHEDLRQLADRYVEIINTVLPDAPAAPIDPAE